ncbi:SDR family oxidoreductase [Smaragdicoccus niigatensis]|uniref:SDR family oxidoreductase n=1 Tax=Smaragdicoccus niigatensis TaxID=359359 RepID=UPI000381A20E|nr:NAD(P)-dependent oxidoreductase [Smaragdicoccus niigatensis]
MTKSLEGKTIIMSGGSRGIGLAIALAAARLGANITILAKTGEPNPKLPGTIYTAAAEIEEAGGQALPVVGDVRDEASVQNAVDKTIERFGGIDIVVNNASAIDLSGTEALSVKKFDLMQGIQIRGTFLLTRAALPHLKKSDNAHILSLSPPLNLSPKWLGAHPAYTLAKYGMSMLTLGWAEEYRKDGIAGNCLWPETLIATAAVQNLLGGDEAIAVSRTPEIVADAAMLILTSDAKTNSGKVYIDAEILADHGVTDLSKYGGGENVQYDIFID